MRKLLARAIVAVVLGIVVGYAVGASLAKDAARGKSLTMKEYIADFDNHRNDLIKGDMPMSAAIIVGILMVVVALGTYEVLVFGVDKVVGLLDRRTDTAGPPPPPWEPHT